IGNLVGLIKAAKYYELGPDEIALTVFTDSLQLYGSRLADLEAERGPYGQRQADRDIEMLRNLSVDYVLDMTHADRRRVHQLKYYTWVEQLGKELDELNAQWDDWRGYWGGLHSVAGALDTLIEAFNQEILR
ncbi:MAG TPA: hypothetical protein VLH39_06665, partial [Magnetospirillaceae bacterium]|nr:hypothetical protein [Magnetospirillaceae bacterium]